MSSGLWSRITTRPPVPDLHWPIGAEASGFKQAVLDGFNLFFDAGLDVGIVIGVVGTIVVALLAAIAAAFAGGSFALAFLLTRHVLKRVRP